MTTNTITKAKTTEGPGVVFPSRGKWIDTPTAIRTVWETRCGQWRIEHYRQKFGRTRPRGKNAGRGGRGGYADHFLACRLVGRAWTIVSRHRTRQAAERAIGEAVENGEGRRKKGEQIRHEHTTD